MHAKNYLPRVAAIGLLVVGSGVSYADEWYASVEAGRSQDKFEPYYTFHYPRTPVTFHNADSGLQLSLKGGRRHQLTDRWSIGGEVRVSANTGEWSVTTTEPATLSYKLPYTVSLSAVPEYRFTPSTSLFLELGLGQGQVEERKTTSSSTKSAYDFGSWETVRTLGVGLRYRLDADKDLYVAYRHTAYASFSYDTHLSDGTLVETISDAPHTNLYSVGVSLRF